MHKVEPKVFLVGETRVVEDGLSDFLMCLVFSRTSWCHVARKEEVDGLPFYKPKNSKI